jgi:methanogenic corrinoid protein MtbC1
MAIGPHEIRAALLSLDQERCLGFAKRIADGEDDVLVALEEGFAAGIRDVGAKFQSGQFFLPELIVASDIMKECIEMLDSRLRREGLQTPPKGTIILGTVEGDIHDIGKAIVSTLLSTAGFEIIDLGVDVRTERFIEAAESHHAFAIAQSALLTVTAPRMSELIDVMLEKGIRHKHKVIIGGAVVTPEFASKIGADGFGADAEDAVRVALRLSRGGSA